MIERAGIGERAYLAIKLFLLTQSDHRPGDRVEVADLSRRVGASATPVRAALHRMAGERLLVSHKGEGFSVPRVTEPGLTDLYQWNAALLVNALRSTPSAAPPALVPAIDLERAPVLALESLFAVLAAHCDNIEVEWAVAGANDRLHRPRRAELALVPEFADEAAELARLIGAGDQNAVRQAIIAYHRKRLRLVPALARHLHGLGDREPR
jgi:hypothetical protein